MSHHSDQQQSLVEPYSIKDGKKNQTKPPIQPAPDQRSEDKGPKIIKPSQSEQKSVPDSERRPRYKIIGPKRSAFSDDEARKPASQKDKSKIRQQKQKILEEQMSQQMQERDNRLYRRKLQKLQNSQINEQIMQNKIKREQFCIREPSQRNLNCGVQTDQAQTTQRKDNQEYVVVKQQNLVPKIRVTIQSFVNENITVQVAKNVSQNSQKELQRGQIVYQNK